MMNVERRGRTASLSVKTVFLVYAVLSLFCSVQAGAEQPKNTAVRPETEDPAFAPVQEDVSLPRVLLIGDSISIGYTVAVQGLLKGKANVLRVPTNGGPTTRGLELLEEWLGNGKWDVIHFNWGLHDVKRMRSGKVDVSGEWQVDPEQYQKNLDALVGRLKTTGVRLIWASTTPVPEGADGRIKGDEVKANAIAMKVMRQHSVPVNDLYAYVLPHLAQYQTPRNVHFTSEGSAFLAKQVAARILEALEIEQDAKPAVLPSPTRDLRVVRLATNPIIRPDMLPDQDGKNINGPSLIRVPEWLPDPLGKYYLYFADHGGKYIRLAYADDLAGPWKIHVPGTLRLEQVPDGKGHMASPDVHVDNERKELRMYFHSVSKTTGAQTTYLAHSTDGIRFVSGAERLGPFYFRVFRFGGYWYAMAKRGWLYRSRDGETQFEAGPNPFPDVKERDGEENGPGCRHVALDVVGNKLIIYFTNIGDMPESVLRSTIELVPDWRNWKASPPELVLKPETEYEGAGIPISRSNSGKAKTRENALRDPCIFKDDGHTYLLYSVAGESGIGIAELIQSE